MSDHAFSVALRVMAGVIVVVVGVAIEFDATRRDKHDTRRSTNKH